MLRNSQAFLDDWYDRRLMDLCDDYLSVDTPQAENKFLGGLAKLQKAKATLGDLLTRDPITDLNIVFGSTPQPKGTATMANKKGTGPAIKTPALKPKSGGRGAVMAPVTLTAVPASITLQPVDASNNPVVLTPSDPVTGTLTSDSASFVVAPGADSTHYGATIPANTPQGTVANLAATLKGTIQGAPADFTASVQLTLDIPPSPVAVDLDIILG